MWPPLFLKPYAGRIICTVIGLVVGILMLTLGFWKTILLVILGLIGYLAGSWKDGQFPHWIRKPHFSQRRLR